MDKNECFEKAAIVTGKVVTGEIITIRDEAVFVDIGAERDAVVPKKDLDELEENIFEDLSEGECVPVFVDHVPSGVGDIFISIAKGIKVKEWQQAGEYLDSGEIIELEVVGQNQNGLLVKFGCLKGSVPISHINGIRSSTKPGQLKTQIQEKIGARIPLKVIEVNPIRNRLILSERDAQNEHKLQSLGKLKVGQIVTGEVVAIMGFGVFVDIGDVEGLLHVSEMGWCRVRRPQEIFNLGDKVVVQIKDVDLERERISLSRKTFLPNPWEEVTVRYSVDDLVEGIITNVTLYGAFVKLPIGIEGLIHKSEMNIGRFLSPRDVHQPGNEVLVRIVSIELDRERIGLSTRRVTTSEQLSWELFKQEDPINGNEIIGNSYG